MRADDQGLLMAHLNPSEYHSTDYCTSNARCWSEGKVLCSWLPVMPESCARLEAEERGMPTMFLSGSSGADIA